MSKAIFCTTTTAQAESIFRALKSGGFSGSDTVLMADKGGTRDFAIESDTKAPEGAVTGAGTGAVLGGTLGWLAGIGALAIPGLGPFIAAGPIMAALSGAVIGGTVGGLTGALIGMGTPEYEAKKFEGKVKAGSSLISVHCDDDNEINRANEIFKRAGATDITTASESVASDDNRR